MTVKTVKLGNIALGSGQPKIAVPITGATTTEIIDQANQIKKANPDVVEWRIDYFEGVTDQNKLKDAAQKLRTALDGMALLTTFRTKSEGGETDLDDANYFKIGSWIVDFELTDALDIELYHDQQEVDKLIDKAYKKQIVVIMSNHHFDKTPSQEEILTTLTKMADRGADVAKVAVMPNSSEDVLTLLTATNKATKKLEIPVITMSMGDLGKVSRISGEVFGSSLTFGAVGAASAPGQISIENLRSDMADLQLH